MKQAVLHIPALHLNSSFPSTPQITSYSVFILCTRWFKYDRDCNRLVYTQTVPVIFEPHCTSTHRHQFSVQDPSVLSEISFLLFNYNICNSFRSLLRTWQHGNNGKTTGPALIASINPYRLWEKLEFRHTSKCQGLSLFHLKIYNR